MRASLRNVGAAVWNPQAWHRPCRSHRWLTTAAQHKPRVIFSGIQPTGIPHLGNYLGALRNWVQLQNDANGSTDQLLFSIVGLHAITVPQDPQRLRQEKHDMMATLLAIGLDPHRVTIFHQDEVREHAELAWYLNCITPMGKLNRMTTWKSKLATIRNAQSEDDIDDTHLSLGLFAYPVLQAADILLYRATHVPVGEDQVQHLELSRDIADSYNRSVKKRFFPLPQHLITPTKRILSLRDASQKMSKSAPDASSRILLTDSEGEIQKKIRRAVTDGESSLSFDPQSRPGVSNLLSILAALEEQKGNMQRSPDEWAVYLNQTAASSGSGVGAVLKEAVTTTIVETLRPIRQQLQQLKADPGHIHSLEALGRERAQSRAQETMKQVRRLSGLSN